MLRKTVIVSIVVLAGIATGYFSRPIYQIFGTSAAEQSAAQTTKPPASVEKAGGASDGVEYITKEAAITAVKTFAPVVKMLGTAKVDGATLDFSTDQAPTGDYPVWLVQVKQTHPDKVPVTLYFQVDAQNGTVLDLQSSDMKLAGVSPGMSRQEAVKIQGRPQKTVRMFDKGIGMNLRIDNYQGLDLYYSPKGTVIKICATGSGMAGPKGVKVGDTKKDALKLLGKATTALSDLLEYRPVDSSASWLILKLDGSGNVQEISVQQAAGSK